MRMAVSHSRNLHELALPRNTKTPLNTPAVRDADPAALPAPGQRTPMDVRSWFTRTGTSINTWARTHGFDPALTYAVIAGKRKCLRGQSHEIAVALGLKHGPLGAARLN